MVGQEAVLDLTDSTQEADVDLTDSPPTQQPGPDSILGREGWA
jgi:hypothetical protein